MNNQPLNLLTNNEQQTMSNNISTNQNEQRQMALASIFNSLSNLAANNNNQLDNNNINIPEQLNNNPNFFQNQQSSPTSMASSHTLQSVMATAAAAAAMQQQQLSLANTNLQQQAAQLNHQSPTAGINFLSPDQTSLYQQDFQINNNQQQRINYCTICNKELCNKYFMKTHMIKMHGINLEMEQADEEEEEEEGEEDNQERDNEQQDVEIRNNQHDEDTSCNRWSPQNNIKNKTFVVCNIKKQNSNNQHQQQNLSTSSAKKKSNSNTNNNNNNNSNSNINNNNKQATSVMNGFAGNSMGGVVCDICNKELCSKYFLKVHKQNTHGIADYQDSACQFAMYPFAGSMGGSNPFIPTGAVVSPTIQSTFTPFSMTNPMNLFAQPQPQNQNQTSNISDSLDSSVNQVKKSNIKRPRLCENQKNQQSSTSQSSNAEKQTDSANFNETNNSESSNKQQFDSVYRLLLAQQQQQPPIPSTAASLMAPIDPMTAAFSAANPLSALMCFGTMGPMGPFGPAGMSPASIVDNILRNQHLFNRNNGNQQQNSSSNNQTSTNSKSKSTDGNNNSDSNQTAQAKGSKDSANNSRYFSHYTEACPMCDRRFKSIKWLKTHMMNDHKQEIGAYMQMMMQYLYNSKSQQMAAAATMAAFEQQQQQINLNHHQQSLLQHLNSQNVQKQQESSSASSGHPSDLSNKCQNLDTSHYEQLQQQQQKATNMILNRLQLKQVYQYPDSRNSPESIFEKSNFAQQESNSFTIDSRCRNESLSPDERNIEQSPSPQNIQPSHGKKSIELVCNLNFQDENLDQTENHNENKFSISAASLENQIDSEEDVSRDSEQQNDDEQHHLIETKASGLVTQVNQGGGEQISVKTTSN